MKTDNIKTKAFESYIKDIKPFHTKIYRLISKYIFADFVHVRLSQHYNTKTKISNDWEITYFSDGTNVEYRIPFCVLPSTTSRIRKHTLVGIVDMIPSAIDTYVLPFNNGVKSIRVDGVLLTKNVDYFIDDFYRRKVRFASTSNIVNNSVINVNMYAMDQIFIALNDVFQTYTISGYNPLNKEIRPEYNDYLIGSYDTMNFDQGGIPTNTLQKVGYNETVFGNYEDPTVDLPDLGRIYYRTDDTGAGYYTFKFYNQPTSNMKITFRIIQESLQTAKVQMFFKEDLVITQIPV